MSSCLIDTEYFDKIVIALELFIDLLEDFDLGIYAFSKIFSLFFIHIFRINQMDLLDSNWSAGLPCILFVVHAFKDFTKLTLP